MYDTILWNQFLESGAVEDYLVYCSLEKKADAVCVNGHAIEGMREREKNHAGLSTDDGYGSKSRADWRI